MLPDFGCQLKRTWMTCLYVPRLERITELIKVGPQSYAIKLGPSFIGKLTTVLFIFPEIITDSRWIQSSLPFEYDFSQEKRTRNLVFHLTV